VPKAEIPSLGQKWPEGRQDLANANVAASYRLWLVFAFIGGIVPSVINMITIVLLVLRP
jgi:hypothetical protein